MRLLVVLMFIAIFIFNLLYTDRHRKLTSKYIESNIVVTISNMHMLELLNNWMVYAKRANLFFNVAALDRKAFLQCYSLSPRRCLALYNTSCVGCDQREYTRNNGHLFRQFGATKVDVILYYLRMYERVIFSDVDSVFLQNPFPFIHSHVDMAVVTDIPDVRKVQNIDTTVNTGLMSFKRSDPVVQFLQRWKMEIVASKSIANDQTEFNNLLFDRYIPNCTQAGKPCISDKKLPSKVSNATFHAPSHGIYIELLDMRHFLQGHTYFVQRVHEIVPELPVHVHVTYTNGGEYGKQVRLIQNRLWASRERHPTAYKVTGIQEITKRIIKSKNILPSAWACDSSDAPTRLFNDSRCFHPDVQYAIDKTDPAVLQLELSRLNRKILHKLFLISFAESMPMIIPKMWCACDRYWWTLSDCRMPGAENMALPFECPLDYLIDVSTWKDDLPIKVVSDASVISVKDIHAETLLNYTNEDAQARMKKFLKRTFETQYTYCSRIRNSNFPVQKNCSGNPMHSYNDPAIDISEGII